MNMNSKNYARYVEARAPRSPIGKNCLWAFLIGGGICKEGENLTKPLLEYIAKESYCIDPNCSTKLDIAKLGNDAGIIGAAYLYTLK